MRPRFLLGMLTVTAVIVGTVQTAYGLCFTRDLQVPRMGLGDNHLAAASGTSVADVWAVGSFAHNGIDRALIEHFDGSVWTIIPSPYDPTFPDDSLYSVSADSPNDAWAVGTMKKRCLHCLSRPFSLHWNGSSWSEVTIPGFKYPFGPVYVDGVSTDPLSGDDAWAVGGVPSQIRNEPSSIFAAHWNGRKWDTDQPPGLNSPVTFGVSTAPGGNAWVVGRDFDNGIRYFILHWDGTSWSTQALVNARDQLSAVAADAPNDAWAAGYLIEHFDGTQWSVALDPSKTNAVLDAVSAIASDDAWAAGQSGALLRWDGTNWTHVRLPQTSFNFSGVQALPAGAITVGTVDVNNIIDGISTLTICSP